MEACKFQHLTLNKEYLFSASDVKCYKCGYLMKTLMSKVVYVGHENAGDYFDVFVPTSPVVCPECNTRVNKFRKPCDGLFNFEDLLVTTEKRK